MGSESSRSRSRFPQQWVAIGLVLIVVAVGALISISGQLGGSRTFSPMGTDKFTTASSDTLSDAVLSVEGMSCGACAARVKGTLKEIDGVAAVQVNLAARRVYVRYADEKVTPERLAAAINEVGYKAAVPADADRNKPAVEMPETSELETRTVTISIDGMACEYCAQSLREKLAIIDGVKAVEIDLKEKKARVWFVEGIVKPERFVKEISAEGFKAGTSTGERQQ